MKNLILIVVFILSGWACRKDKLTGDYAALAGTWTSIETTFNCGTFVGRPMNPDFKLVLMDKGRYVLYEHGKKKEEGRLLMQNQLVTFRCIKRKSEWDGRSIVSFTADSLNVDYNGCRKDYQYSFVRE